MMKRTMQMAALLTLAAFPAFAQDAAAPVVDSGNTAWLLVSAALVMLMTPGLALFYGGMVSHKNVVSTLLQNYVALALVGIIWVVIGYSLAFTEGSEWIGGTDALLLKGLDTTMYGDTGVPYLVFAAFQMMFAIITPALITGAFAERVSFKAWLLIMAAWSLLVYVPVAHWVWGPGGWLASAGSLDFAGGLVVHVTAGFSALVAALVFGKRTNGEPHPYDVPMVMLGAALLWFGWFGFNAGSALTSGALAAYAFINTFIAAAVAFLVWMLIDWVRVGKPSAIGASIGIVVGLVAITPAAGYVTISSAIIIGAVAAVVCNYVARFVKSLTHLDDALDVFACHGVGGLVGAVLTGIFATKEVNASIANEGILVSGDSTLFIANVTGVLAVAVFSMIATYIIIKLVNVVTPIRVAGHVEDAGLDHFLHGEYVSSSIAKNRKV
jgi:Amt family ammonium transporter